jgi:hypothetical protein
VIEVKPSHPEPRSLRPRTAAPRFNEEVRVSKMGSPGRNLKKTLALSGVCLYL